jgi:hypothetical protein
MISPFALYFYTVYGPVLRFFDKWAGTAWLTQFFLPHISETRSPFLNILHGLAWPLILIGTGLFLGGAVPLYWAKFRRQGAVTTGLYAFIRHPQYVGLAVVGLGTLLFWPRFFVLIIYLTMLFLYGLLARWGFDRRYYKPLFTRARTHAAQASGKNIVKTAYGLHPIVLVKVDISSLEVTGVETPPPHVSWGDIPTPLF